MDRYLLLASGIVLASALAHYLLPGREAAIAALIDDISVFTLLIVFSPAVLLVSAINRGHAAQEDG